jgi:hypothetical protein
MIEWTFSIEPPNGKDDAHGFNRIGSTADRIWAFAR